MRRAQAEAAAAQRASWTGWLSFHNLAWSYRKDRLSSAAAPQEYALTDLLTSIGMDIGLVLLICILSKSVCTAVTRSHGHTGKGKEAGRLESEGQDPSSLSNRWAKIPLYRRAELGQRREIEQDVLDAGNVVRRQVVEHVDEISPNGKLNGISVSSQMAALLLAPTSRDFSFPHLFVTSINNS